MSEEPRLAQYSKAFELLVSSEPNDDIVGLLAYALYKKAVRESILGGQRHLASPLTTPSPTEQGAYRGAAERLLQKFSEASIEAVRPELIASSLNAELIRVEASLTDFVRERTSARSAIITNVVAWLITLAVTVLIVNFFYLPNWQEYLVHHLPSQAR